MAAIPARAIFFGYLATAVVGSLLVSIVPVASSLVGEPYSMVFARRVEDIPFVFAMFTVVSLLAGLPATGLLWLLRRYWLGQEVSITDLQRKLFTTQAVLGVLTFLMLFVEEAGGQWSAVLLMVVCYVPVGTFFLWLFRGGDAGARVDPKRSS
jgi:hypothetical protein